MLNLPKQGSLTFNERTLLPLPTADLIISMKTFNLTLLILFSVFFSACQSMTPQQYAALPDESRNPIRTIKDQPPTYPSEYVVLKTRPMAFQRFLYLKPAGATQTLILFTGSGGNLNLKETDGKVSLSDGNFLLRNRDLFAAQGFAVAMVEIEKNYAATNDAFRTSAEHLADIERVIDFLHRDHMTSIWLVGTSRGTISAAAVAIGMHQNLNGLVLTSTLESVANQKIAQIKLPTLIVSHADDTCSLTPPSAGERLKKAMINSMRVDFQIVRGGAPPAATQKTACGPWAPHGFAGIDKDVVSLISHFIEQNTVRNSEHRSLKSEF